MDLRWMENRRLVLVHDSHCDRGRRGRHGPSKRHLVGRHHQQSKDRTALKIQILGRDGEQGRKYDVIHMSAQRHEDKMDRCFPTLAVLRIPSILLEPVVMLKSPLSLPLIIEYLVLAFGEPNSSLSVTFSLITSAPTSFSGTEVDIWGKSKKLCCMRVQIKTYFYIIVKYLCIFNSQMWQ